MSKWQTTPLELPIDGVPCWVRLNYWFGAPFRATYNVATEEWVSTVNGLTYPVWSISRWKYEFDALIATLTATGTGAGVTTFRIEVSSDQTIYLDGAARFYTDAAGTLGESITWAVTAGALRTIYLKCTTGTANMYITEPLNVIKWGNSTTDGWTSGTNAAKINIEIGELPLTQFNITGNSEITGALPSGLTWLQTVGSGINWTYAGALPAGVTYLYIDSANIAWTYSGALPAGLTALRLLGAAVAWTYSGALPAGVTAININGAGIDWTYNQITGTANFSVFLLANYRVGKMSSANMVIMLDSMRTKTGTFPATVTINDYADYAAPPVEVTDAVAALKAAKSITTVNLGA